MRDHDAHPPFPTDPRDLRARPRELATETVPPDLAGLDAPVERRTRQLVSVERSTPGLVVAEPVEGFCPPWCDRSYRPRRAKLPPPPRVSHHGAPLTPHFIIHPDNRRIYDDTSYPYGCICRVITASGRPGSGVLVGPRHVLTASHCIEWTTDIAEAVEVHRQGQVFSATTFDTDVLAYTQIVGGPSITTLDEDYAVMILADRLGDRFGWLGVRTYDSDWDDEGFWTTIGYPSDLGGLVPVFQQGVHLDEDPADLGGGRAMTTNADVMKGHSGGPFFADFEGGTYVAAVTSAEGSVLLSGNENWCSGGNDMTRLVNQARRDFP